MVSIGNKAFYGCCGLEAAIIPDSVTSIGSEAFSGCDGLSWILVIVSEETENYPDFSSSFPNPEIISFIGVSSPISPVNIDWVEIQLFQGWNLISFPGDPVQTDPSTLQTTDYSLIFPFYRWNTTSFAYEAITKLKFGEAYWVLVNNPNRDKMGLLVYRSSTCHVTLQRGWNLIGSVSQTVSFTRPITSPANSIVLRVVYGWDPIGLTYRSDDKILPGYGYWVLAKNQCQLTIGETIDPVLAPQVLGEPELMIGLKLSAGDWSQQLEIGKDRLATDSLDVMDQAIPPEGPIETKNQAYLINNQFRLSRDLRPIITPETDWQIQVISPNSVQLTIDRIKSGHELLVRDSHREMVLTSGMQMQLESGNQELTVSLRPLPKLTQVLQNYPNPFNPETWIPYQLNQLSEVSLRIYSSNGSQIRHIDLGVKRAGNYQTVERAIYWDGRNSHGEQVSSGTYFYRLETIVHSQTRKMVILK